MLQAESELNTLNIILLSHPVQLYCKWMHNNFWAALMSLCTSAMALNDYILNAVLFSSFF